MRLEARCEHRVVLLLREAWREPDAYGMVEPLNVQIRERQDEQLAQLLDEAGLP